MSDVRELSLIDLEWLLDLLGTRARARADAAAWFWTPSPDARAVQQRWLRGLIEDPRVPALRTEHGAAIATPEGRGPTVDDFAVEHPGSYADDGRLLLEGLRVATGGPLHVVVPCHETERLALAEGVHWLARSEVWWTRSLADLPEFATTQGTPLRLPTAPTFNGTQASLVMPPPVYQQERPVVAIRVIDPSAEVSEIERWAAAQGALAAAIMAPPTQDWSSAGYQRTTDWFAAP